MTTDKTTSQSNPADGAGPDNGLPSPADQGATMVIWQQNIRTLVALNVVSVSVAVLLLVGLLFSWATIADLNGVRQEIDALKQFEKRIAGNVNLMNEGIQNRLSKIDRRISSIQTGIGAADSSNGNSRDSIRRLNTVIDDGNELFVTETADLMLIPALTSNAPSRFVPRQTGVQVSVSKTPDKPEGSSLFRRVVTADGKVRYEKK